MFASQSIAFTTALATQMLLALSLPIISFDRLLSAVVGVALLGIGLHWSVRAKLEIKFTFFCFSVVAGVVLGGL